ncbi:MAG: WD40 repeat domain-containing protein [Planctomycetes bacterium]|nr:WD40 repeat domain-containing protein [Planctomycetota bacterium]
MRPALICLLIISPATVGISKGGNKQHVVQANQPRSDAFGDPLPEGVFYRLGTVRMRHQHTQALIFSADGSQLLSQGATPDLRVWDVATGRIVRQFAAPKECRQLIASPDDRYLACVSHHHHVVLVDKATGEEMVQWHHPTGWLALTFSKDGLELVGLASGELVVKWDVAERKETARVHLDLTKLKGKNFDGHWSLSAGGVTVAFKPHVANGEPVLPWHFWYTATGKQAQPPLDTKASPSQAHWSPDGRTIAVITSDSALEVWDTVAGKRLTLEASGPFAEGTPAKFAAQRAAFHPSGTLLAVANNGMVAIWNMDTGKQLWKKKFAFAADVLAFSRDGKTLAVGRWGVISLIETATGDRVGFSRRDPGTWSLAGWERSASFFRDGQSFAVYDQAGLSQLETATGKRLRAYYSEKSGGFYYGGLCGNGRLFACVGHDEHGAGQIFMFEAATGKELWRRPKHPSAIHISADGKKVAVLSWNEDEFTLLDATTGREIKKLPPPSYRHDGNTLVAVSDDLCLAASARSWRNIELWELATGKMLRSMECPSHWTNGSLYFVPGNEFIVGAPDRYYIERETKGVWARVWDVGTGRILQSFDEPILKMSADGRWLALQGEKGIAVRHLQTGRLVGTLDGLLPYGGSRPLEFSPDGSLLAVRKASGHEVGLWDTFTGRRVCRWVDPLSSFDGAAFAPNGCTMVLSVRTGGSMLVCDVTGRATAPGKLPSQDITPAELHGAWLELTSDDGPRSHRARWTLVAGGEHTVKMLQRALRPVEPLDRKNLAALIAGLDSESFKERQKSTLTLEQMALARPALENALKHNPSLEMQRRIDRILAKQDGLSWDVELRRAMRGVLLLEQIGTSTACKLLQSLASGATGSPLTQEAKAAIGRKEKEE